MFLISCSLLVAMAILGICTAVNINQMNSSSLEFKRKQGDSRSIGSNICKTRDCINLSKRIRLKMDWTVDPCDDFYQFACGNFMKTEKIPKVSTSLSTFTKTDASLSRKLHRILTKTSKTKELRVFNMTRYFYNLCLDEDSIESRGISKLLEILKQAGGWPVLEGEDWIARNYSWVDTVYRLSNLSIESNLINIALYNDLVNPSRKVIYIDQLSFYPLEQEFLLQGRQSKLVEAYAAFMVDLSILLGANNKSAVEDMSAVLDFEIDLAKISSRKEDRRDSRKQYNPMSISDLNKKYSLVNWAEFIERSFLKNTMKLASTEIVIVMDPPYLEKLQKLLEKTDKRVVANFLFWGAANQMASFLTKPIRERMFLFYQNLTGIQKQTPRQKECLALVRVGFELAISSMFVRSKFNKHNKAFISNMVENLSKEMIKVLKTVDWMDKHTRAKGLQKVKALKKTVAYPEELLDDNKVEQFYEQLNIFGEPFLESVLKIKNMKKNFSLALFQKTFDKNDWRIITGKVMDVNAYYLSALNRIVIPAAILDKLFFSSKRPQYMNYGSIGVIIGHEITHGFDDQGRLFDKEGNLVDWWEPKTSEAFKTRVQCVIDEANHFIVGSVNMSLNGIATQGENVADLGGVKLSMRAYNKWVLKNNEEPRLIGLENYSPRQMFWLSVASTFCKKSRREFIMRDIVTNPHPIHEFRVFNFVKNSKMFAKDFNCPKGSRMNPSKKCKVW